MADDKLFPESQTNTDQLFQDQPQAGGAPLDPAAGASVYLESAADSGEINLDDLSPSPPPEAETPPRIESPAKGARSKAAAKPKPAAPKGPLPGQAAPDFPSEALNLSAPETAGGVPGLAPPRPPQPPTRAD